MVIVVVVVALQVVVPALALRHERPAAFGWQMFAAEGAAPIVELVDRDGEVSMVPRGEVRATFGNYRPEVGHGDELARHLCDRSTDAVAVVVRDRSSGDVEVAQRC